LARFAYPAKASNLGLTAFYKRAVSMRGLSSGLIRGNAPRSISGVITMKGGDIGFCPYEVSLPFGIPVYYDIKDLPAARMI